MGSVDELSNPFHVSALFSVPPENMGEVRGKKETDMVYFTFP